MPSLMGKVAVVTGASRGAGRCIALALGEAGATVYVTGRSARGAGTTEDLPGTTESPEYVGRAVAALAADTNVMQRSGQILTVGDLAQEYGFTDIDGRQVPAFRIED